MKVTYPTILILVLALYVDVSVGKRKKTRVNKEEEERHQILVKSVMDKVKNLSLYFVSTPVEDRPKVLKNIEHKLRLAAKLMRLPGDKYVKYIMDGIVSGITDKKTRKDMPANEIFVVSNLEYVNENVNKQKATAPVRGDDDMCDCSCIEEKLCSKIKALNKFACNDSNISIEKLCDGEYDCKDKFDEEQCTLHANRKLSEAKMLVREIEHILQKRCLEVQISIDKVIMKSQELALTNVLKKQSTILNQVNAIANIGDNKTVQTSENANNIIVVVNSVAFALQGIVCIRDNNKKDFSNRDETSLDKFSNGDDRLWAPPLCTCRDGLCLLNNCTPACSDTCWQRHSLGQWLCENISGARSVSIDLICDGKVDCLDGSDEDRCTSGAIADKFEATQMYNSILQVLSSKITSSEFHLPIRNNFIKLQEAIKKFQEESFIDHADISTMKHLREQIFDKLLSIYDGITSKSNKIKDVHTKYIFLKSVSYNIVNAMKRLKTGNERIAPSYSCLCVRGKCHLTECSAACVRACAVESLFMDYTCRGDTNATISIVNICNGKAECPKGDDEEKCKDDICRNHHLVVLRNKIANHKDDRWGSVFEDILGGWKEKTISTIRNIDEMKRINRGDLQKLLTEISFDLVQTYVTLPKTSRRTDPAAAFLDLSRVIQDTLRDCTK